MLGWRAFGAFLGQPNPDGSDAFLAKYSSSGTQLCFSQFGTNSHEWGYAAAVDSADNAYIIGGTGGSGGLSGGIADEAFLAKFSPECAQHWVTQFGTIPADDGWGVAVDSDDTVYVAGPTLGTFPGQGNAGDFDAYLTRWPECACPGDTNGDGAVNVIDLVNVIVCWGTDGADCQDPGDDSDVTADCTVNVLDLVEVILNWGAC